MSDVATAPHPALALAPPASPLRVGLLVDSLEQPAWVERAVGEVAASSYARIVLVIEGGRGAATPHSRDTTLPGWKYRLFAAYERFDRRWFSDGRLDPFEPATLAPLVTDAPRLDALLDVESGELSASTIGAIREHDLDVILRFGVDGLEQAPVGVARLGVWSVDSPATASGPEPLGGFWEVMRGSAITESTLVIDGLAGGRRRTIYRSFGSTSPVSVWKTRRERYWKVASFMSRKLRDVAEQGAAGIAAVPARDTSDDTLHPSPTNARLVTLLPRIATRYAKLQVERKACFDQWFVAYHFAAGAPAEAGVPEMSFDRFRQLTPPRDRLWADPFPVYHRGRHYLFLEEMLYARNKGHISVIEFENDEARRPEMVLETGHHLSYPFVLEWRGEMFMIPESARAGDSPAEQAQLSIPVFRAQDFPRGWVQETAMLENLEVFDPTLAEIDGRWWLFCTRGELGASSWDELHLFHAPTPFGPWTPHRRNPVKSDVRSARPAGRIFRRGGEWYRPAQDCSVRYGYGMSINRITRLTPTEYEEVVVEHVAPDWTRNLIGTHTLNAAGRLSVVDGIRRRRRWSGDATPLPRRAPDSDR
jgi:hypothetical protein